MGISQQIGASSIVKWGTCTSSTRPASPYEGQHIYETDTDIEYVWNGSAWVVNYVSAASPVFTGTPTAPTATAGTNTTQIATMASKPWNVAWGVVGGVSRTSGNTTSTTGSPTDITGVSITFTAIANRTYKITWSCSVEKTVASGWTGVFLANAANTIFATVYSSPSVVGTGYGVVGGFHYMTAIPAGSYTLKLRTQTESNTSIILASGANPTNFIIEDVGPA